MDLLKVNFLRGGIFKQVKFLVSTPQQSAKAIYHREAGTVALEVLPIFTGFMNLEIDHKTWKAEHILKLRVLKDGEPVMDETVLVINDRSYMPMDPTGIVKEKDKASRRTLLDIAAERHDQVVADIKGGNQPTTLAQIIITGGYIILAICIIANIWMRKAS